MVNRMSVWKKFSVDSDEAYQRIDLLYGMEEQLTSLYKIKEHCPREGPEHMKQLTLQELCQKSFWANF
jgi:hypothetical protein